MTIDIKPGSSINSVNPRSNGVIPLAILSDETFDAQTVDPLSVSFGPGGAPEAHGKGHREAVDEDGDQDLMLHFETQASGIQCGDTSASLTGMTFDGQVISGTDSLVTVGCNSNKPVESSSRIMPPSKPQAKLYNYTVMPMIQRMASWMVPVLPGHPIWMAIWGRAIPSWLLSPKGNTS